MVLVALADTGLTNVNRLGKVSSVPPPAMAFTPPATNAEEQRSADAHVDSVIT